MKLDSEQNLLQCFELSPLPYQSLDENGKIISVNSAWGKYFMRKKEAVIGKYFTDLLTPSSAKYFSENLRAFISKDFAKNIELEIVKSNGKITPVLLNGYAVKNNNGVFLFFSNTLTDHENYKKSSEKIEAIIDAMDESIWAIDKENKLFFFNEKFKNVIKTVFGVDVKKGMNALNILPDQKLNSFWRKKYSEVFSGEKQRFHYTSMSRKIPHFFDISLTPIISNNSIEGVSAISKDITEKKILDQKVYEKDIWYKAVFENSKDAIFITTEDSKFYMVNEAAVQLTGYSKEELLQMSIPDLHDENDLEAYKTFFERIFSGEEIISEAKILKKDGGKVEAEFSNKPIKIGDKTFMHTIARDISERKYFQNKLEKSLNDYKRVFDNASDAILIFEPETEIIFDVNKTAAEIYGFTRNEFIGMDLRTISKTPERGQKFIKQTVQIGHVPNFITTHFNKKGEEVIFNVGGFLTNFKGKKAIISFNREITDLVKMEEELKESEKFYRVLFESSPVGIYVARPDGTIIDANPKLLKMLGSPSLEATKKINLLTLPNLIESKYSDAFSDARETGKTIVFNSSYISKWGKKIFLYSIIVPLKNKYDEVEKIFAVIQDRTKEQEYLDRLKESESLFRDVFNSSINAIAISEPATGKYILVNKGFADMMEYSVEDVIGKSSIELGIWEHPEQRKDFVKELKKNKGLQNHQISFKSKSGRIKTAIVSSEIIKIRGEEFFLNTAKDITDLIEIQNILTETEKLYETLFEKLSDSVVIYDLKGRILTCNNTFLKHLGYPKEKIIGQTPAVYTSAEEAAKIPERLKELADKGEILVEALHITKDGVKIPVEINAKLIEYRGEKAILAVNRDISERKEVTRKLEESEKLFRGVFNTSLDAITISDVDSGKYLQVNKGFTEILGYSEEEAIGKTSVELGIWQNENDRKSFLKAFNSEGALREYVLKMKAKSGEIKTALISSELITLKGKEYFLNTGKDISRLIETQQTLFETEKLYETLFELSPSGIILLDLEGNIIDINRTYCAMLQYSEDELKGMNISKLNSSETPEQIKQNVKKIISRKTFNHEVINIRKDSTEIYLALREKLITLPNGTKGILSIAIDITERKKYEAEIQKSRKKLKQLTDYLQNIREEERREIARRIHDVLGQSLTAVQFETAWLQKHFSDDETISERLSRLKNTVAEMTMEVQNISSELRPRMLDELGLASAIEWYCDEFEKKSGIKIHTRIEPEELYIDNKVSIHLFRMMQECLTNVWRHSKATRVNVELKVKNATLYLSIRDNGIGMDDKKIQNIKSFGLLGLKERVFSLQGHIDFISAPGKGTKIKIVIPLMQNDNSLI